jgi:hypothetical protein
MANGTTRSARAACCALAFLALGIAGVADAVPITYTFTFNAGGTLGVGPAPPSFSATAFTITAVGDTVNATTVPGPAYCNAPLSSVTFSSSAGSGTVTDSIVIFQNAPNVLGLFPAASCATVTALWFASNNAGLPTDVLPLVQSTIALPSPIVNEAVATSIGTLTFTSISALTYAAAFTAPPPVPTAAVATPTLGFDAMIGVSLLTAMLGAVVLRRRRG